MTWVKVCGLRRSVEVSAALEAGADAIGFVLAASPRRVSAAEARVLGEEVSIQKVIVTVDLDPAALLAAASTAGADGVQPYGNHRRAAAAAASAAGLFVLHPLGVGDSLDLAEVPSGQVPILDSETPGLHGGTGRTFDWSLARGIGRPFVLAGGLGPENVLRALEEVAPWGVDASSRLESAPGVKDPARISAFVEAVKQR